MAFIEDLLLICNQGVSSFSSLNSFHNFRISDLNLLVQVGLSKFSVCPWFIYHAINYLSIERKHETVLLALNQPLKVSWYDVVNHHDPVVNQRKCEVLDDGELSEPKTNREEKRIVQMPNQILPRVQWYIHIVHVQINALSQVSYTQSWTLVVLKLLPKNALQSNQVPASYLSHK